MIMFGCMNCFCFFFQESKHRLSQFDIKRILLAFLMLHALQISAQRQGLGGRLNSMGQGGSFGSGGGAFKDSLQHRSGMEDSATILYRTLEDERYYFQDSSVHDFSKRWPVPWSHYFLGNTGSASRSLIFSPHMQAGWDHGLHAYDPYHTDLHQSRFYNVTRPFTELSYILASRREQNIGVFHTQNIRYNWNFSVDYRLINAPGFFKNQKNSHDRYGLNTWYRSKNNRYFLFIAAGSSKTGASENGGVADLSQLQDIPAFSDRFSLPVNLGGNQFESRTLLSNVINTGNIYKRKQLLVRNSFDFGRKDSVRADSGYTRFFVPRFRFQYTYQMQDHSYRFADNRIDTTGYIKLYNLRDLGNEWSLEDRWRFQEHEFSILHFPDPKNQTHAISAGISYQQIEGRWADQSVALNNAGLTGSYRNKTRNGKWDFHLSGLFFAGGDYAGDYQAALKLVRFSGKRNNLLTLEVQNVNRTPSFIHNDLSRFKLFNRGNPDFLKENHSVLSGKYIIPHLKMELGVRYQLMSNYTYFYNIRASRQESTVFNVVQANLARKFRLSRGWSWYVDLVLQQSTANAPVNLPLVLTRNRIAYEGKHFKQLNISTGLEIRYASAFKADGYSPVLGQFYLQNDTVIENLPDVAAYLHFRIRSWYLFARAENLNAVSFSPQFGFFENNFAAPSYPMPGLLFRIGIYWGMVN
jgi:hypothetical protein